METEAPKVPAAARAPAQGAGRRGDQREDAEDHRGARDAAGAAPALRPLRARCTKKFYAHDESGEARQGDTVRIVETRPLSKLKRWRLAEVVSRRTSVD